MKWPPQIHREGRVKMQIPNLVSTTSVMVCRGGFWAVGLLYPLGINPRKHLSFPDESNPTFPVDLRWSFHYSCRGSISFLDLYLEFDDSGQLSIVNVNVKNTLTSHIDKFLTFFVTSLSLYMFTIWKCIAYISSYRLYCSITKLV
jgi:hypothetical protein